MRILLIGAGPLGTIFTGLFKQANIDITLLARGKRYESLKNHGVELYNFNEKEYLKI